MNKKQDSKQRFFRCSKCGNIVAIVKDSGAPITCCGEFMKEITSNTVDTSLEKHIPVYYIENNKVIVNIGSIEHPMLPEHFIEWISIQTKNGNQRKILNPGEKPSACFALCENDEVEAIYAYCNLHGLWKK